MSETALQYKETLLQLENEYNLNGGQNNSKNPKTYTMDTETIQLKNPTKKDMFLNTDMKIIPYVRTVVTGEREKYHRFQKAAWVILYCMPNGRKQKSGRQK